MARKVYIYDASAIIFSGATAKRSRHWNTKYFPTGGLYSIFQRVFSDMAQIEKDKSRKADGEPEDLIIICFDTKENIRRDRFPDYKATRTIKKSPVEREQVNVQLEAAQVFLSQAGFNVISNKGYEADDAIYSYAKIYKDCEIIIRADDSDLYDVKMIAPKARMFSVSGRDERDMKPYTLASKLMIGDASDDITTSYTPQERTLVERIIRTEQFNPYLYPEYEDAYNKLIEIFVPEETAHKIARVNWLLQPKEVKAEELPPTVMNKKSMSRTLNILGFKKFLESYLNEPRSYDAEGVQEGVNQLLIGTSYELKEHMKELDENSGSSYKKRNNIAWEVPSSEPSLNKSKDNGETLTSLLGKIDDLTK